MSRFPTKIHACCTALILASLLVWSSSPCAQEEVQNAPSVRYFGQPVERTHPVEYQLAISPSEMAALLKQDSVQSKAKADKDDATLLDADQRSAIESTVGTWFQGGHTGAWYNSNQDGHGLFLEVLSDPSTATGMQVFAAWYAYLDGRQVWLVAQGPVAQESNRHRAYLDAYIYEGGDFPPNFNPNVVNQIYWGGMTLQFNGCNHADLSWSTSYPGFSSGQLALQRLTTVQGSSCNPNLGGSSGGTPDDHGNSRSNRSPLTIGGTGGVIEIPGDVDAFGWTSACGGSGQNVRHRLWTTGSLDTVGELRQSDNPSGPYGAETLIASNDDGGEGSNFLIDVETPCAGDFTLYVSGYGSSTGSYSVWRESSTLRQTVTIRVDFENRLLKDIQVFQNGTSLGVVEAGRIQGGSYEVASGDQFSFRTIQNYGDHMEGIYPPITNLNVSQINYLANNVIGSSWFFVPYITNNTSVGRLLGVNMELQSENRCNCVIPANTPNVVAGYFRLYTNSNLRLYDAASNYTGPYTYWQNFSGYAQEDTGRINFTLN